MAHQHEVQLKPLTQAGSGVIPSVQRQGRGLVAFVRRFPVGCVGALVLVCVAFLAIAAPLVSRSRAQGPALLEPSAWDRLRGPRHSHPPHLWGARVFSRVHPGGRAGDDGRCLLGRDQRLHRGEI